MLMAVRSVVSARNPLPSPGPRSAFDLSHWHPFAKYGLAVALTAASLGLRWLLDPLLGNRIQQAGNDGVLIKIVDDGVGIPDNFSSKLFSAFVSSKGEHGTGLGLWV